MLGCFGKEHRTRNIEYIMLIHVYRRPHAQMPNGCLGALCVASDSPRAFQNIQFVMVRCLRISKNEGEKRARCTHTQFYDIFSWRFWLSSSCSSCFLANDLSRHSMAQIFVEATCRSNLITSTPFDFGPNLFVFPAHSVGCSVCFYRMPAAAAVGGKLHFTYVVFYHSEMAN